MKREPKQTCVWPVLFLIIFALKLTGYITWSWIWITAA